MLLLKSRTSYGPGGVLYKSLDEGLTWTQITGHGLPDGEWGREGVAVAPGNHGQHVYVIVEEVLAQHELAIANVRRAEQEDVGAGAAHQSGRLGVEEDDVLPSRGRRALEPEVRDHTRVGLALPDHGEAERR